ncbi:hypothetical protein NA78x_002272 [Anatilimnocola sp. NA78]|uniref:hypothetical protein n=1 Tax=Anatilimnocola sp. NA78 TaxID=3415683 RepID=UPI003CE51FA4
MDEGFELPPNTPKPWWLWSFQALGIRYTFLLPVVAAISLVLILVVCLRCRNQSLTALLAVLIPIPVFVGLVSVVDGIVSSFQGITHPTAEYLAEGMALSLFGLKVSMWLALPGFLLATGILVCRSLTDKPDSKELPSEPHFTSN